MVRGRIAWIEFESALEFLLGAGSIPIIIVHDVRHRSMRLGQGGFELESFCCRLLCFGESLAGARVRIKGKASIGVRQPGVERSILGIFLDSLAEVHKRKLQIVLGALIQRVAALEVEIICFWIESLARSR